MKRFVSIALIFLLAVSITSCSKANEPIKIGKVDYAPHGDKAFCVAIAVMQGDKIIGAYLDEYQFMPKESVTGVPNSDQLGDGAFATNFDDPGNTVLASKRENADYYSDLMKNLAGSKVSVTDNYKTIQDYVIGKTIAELESDLSGKDAKQMVDAVSSATLVDTKGYVKALVEAAKSAQ